MSRDARRILAIVSLVAVVGCGQSAPATAPVATPAAASAPAATPAQAESGGPTFELSLTASDPAQVIADTGPFVSDPAAMTSTCTRLEDGYWKMDYSGGDPYVRLNVLVGPEASAGGRSGDVSAEIVIGSPLTSLLNFDQPGYRSGDAPGRSTAAVDTTVASDAITFDISATTPAAKIDFTDYPYKVDIDLHVVCPTGG